MQRSEYTNGRNEEIKAWVEEHPEIKSKIEERIRNVPEANRERAFINAAKTEAMNQAVQPAGPSVRPQLQGIPGGWCFGTRAFALASGNSQ